MNNQHLFIDDFLEMKKWNLAVRYFSAQQPTIVGLSRFNDVVCDGSIVQSITIDFQWTFQIDSGNNPIKGSWKEYGSITFENPIVVIQGDPLILKCKNLTTVSLSQGLAELFRVQELQFKYKKLHHHP